MPITNTIDDFIANEFKREQRSREDYDASVSSRKLLSETEQAPDQKFAEGEFRSITRDVNRVLIRALGAITLIYASILVLVVPWDLYEVIERGALTPLAGILSLLGFVVMIRAFIVHSLAMCSHDSMRFNTTNIPSATPLVSILVPAYNEGETIESALKSIVTLNYPRYEVIVVDDGSKDQTYNRALPFEGEYERCTVRVFKKPNGGKWSALNFAYKESKGDFILCVDADSRLSKNTLRSMVARCEEPGVCAVSGQVTIRNRRNILTRLQAFEYVTGNGAMRAALGSVGLVTIVPGPIGLYRREIMDQIEKLPCNNHPQGSHGEDNGKVYGPLSGETFAEDFQLSLSVLALGGKIVYEPSAISYTKCPETLDGLISQRYRWMRGTFQVFRVYVRDLRSIAKPKRKGLDALMLGLYLFDIYLSPILNIMFWGIIMVGVVAVPGTAVEGKVLWAGAVLAMNFMAATFYILIQDDDLTLVPLSIVAYELYNCFIVNAGWMIGVIDEIRGARMRWH